MCAAERTSTLSGNTLSIMNDSAILPVPILLMECFLAGFGRPEAEKYWE